MMNKIKYGLFTLIIAVIWIFSPAVLAQDNNETERINALKEMLKSESFNLSTLIQPRFVFDFDDEAGSRGFSVPQARLKVYGKLDGGFSYNLHFDAADSFILLDAYIGYAINDKTNFTVGAQKPGISYEYLTGPNKIDFVSRSFIVVALTQNRDFGAKLQGNFTDKFNYSAGIFNGNRLASNDNNKFYYAGRLGYSSTFNDNGTLVAGINASYGEQTNTQISSGVLPNINGERIIYGWDFRFENSALILASEILAASLEYIGFAGQDNVIGLHITGGYKVTQKSRVLFRFENLKSDQLAGIDRDRLRFGFTHSPTKQTKYRINYLLPLDDSEFINHGLALNYQIAF